MTLDEHVLEVSHDQDASRSSIGGYANLICGSKEFRIIVYQTSFVERDLRPRDRFLKVLSLCIRYHRRIVKGLEHLLFSNLQYIE